ncbi:MBL fold metallo-hydrolase [Planktotalea sp.]|uniref:MBL fold metallo-hydrolase n=1 Tax=Planktotalea sp. TaxID=2029877 RepID=UPI003D6ADAA9
MLCRIGDVEVWRILESNDPFKTPEELFPNAGADVRDIIERHVSGACCAQSGKLILPVQGFLLKTPDHLILVDACVGNDKTVPSTPDWHQRKGTRFMDSLAAAGADVADVDYVLCTHLHTDHVGWNTRLVDGRWVPTFPNAKYMLPEADDDFFSEHAEVLYSESVSPVVEAGQSERVSAGHMLGDYVSLIPTPGHTPGHVSVLIKSGDAEAVITGDAIHTTAQLAHPEWHFKYDMDGDQAEASRRALLGNAAERNQRVLGSHFALPSLERIRAKGDAFEWDAD